MKDYLPFAFILGAVLSWGCYVPTLHKGQMALKTPDSAGSLRAFLCVGLAYFLTAVLVPLFLLLVLKQEPMTFNGRGVGLATFAGVLGAAGALCIILSVTTGGNPIYVAPLVFAGAPIINTFITMRWDPPKTAPNAVFYAGIALAAVGAFLVLYNKPK